MNNGRRWKLIQYLKSRLSIYKFLKTEPVKIRLYNLRWVLTIDRTSKTLQFYNLWMQNISRKESSQLNFKNYEQLSNSIICNLLF